MLIPLADLVETYAMHISGVLHCGAHKAEEAPVYDALGITEVVWVEANPDLIAGLYDRVAVYGHRVIQSLISDSEVQTDFHITNNGESSSVLELGTHKETSPQVHVTKTISLDAMRLDRVYEEYGLTGLNFLNLDLQGAELMALRSLGSRLREFDYIYSEVNKREVYKGCAQVGDLDDFLTDFTRVETLWCTDGGRNHGWGDCLYVRSAKCSGS